MDTTNEFCIQQYKRICDRSVNINDIQLVINEDLRLIFNKCLGEPSQFILKKLLAHCFEYAENFTGGTIGNNSSYGGTHANDRFEILLQQIDNFYWKRVEKMFYFDKKLCTSNSLILIEGNKKYLDFWYTYVFDTASLVLKHLNNKLVVCGSAAKSSKITTKTIRITKTESIEVCKNIDNQKDKKDIYNSIDTFLSAKKLDPQNTNNNLKALKDSINKILKQGCVFYGDKIEARLNCESYLATFYKDKAWLIYKHA